MTDPALAALTEHPLTPGKPCPGGGLCCNRPEFDRAMFPCSQIHQQKAEIDRLRAALRDLAAKPELWECRKCGFEMHAKHYDPRQEEPCPCCSETAARAENERLWTALSWTYEGHEEGCPCATCESVAALLTTRTPAAKEGT